MVEYLRKEEQEGKIIEINRKGRTSEKKSRGR
jgi:hypothetical protein